NLFDLEGLQRLHTLHPELLVRVDGSLRQLLADLDAIAVGHGEPRPEGNRVLDLVAVVGRDGDAAALLLHAVFDLNAAGQLRDLRLSLGPASLEELDHSRQTVCAVLTGHNARVA